MDALLWFFFWEGVRAVTLHRFRHFRLEVFPSPLTMVNGGGSGGDGGKLEVAPGGGKGGTW